MLFNSASYLFAFLPGVVLIYWQLRERLRLWFILLASLAFYGFWRIEFIPLLLFSAALDYVLALWIEATGDKVQRRRIMLLSVVCNIGILAFFKYLLFFRDTLWSIAAWVGYHPGFVELNVILPLGISFYIFATISYVIDVYRGEFKAERNFVVYCCFVVFFPHLVAGPILRARNLIPQLRQPPTALSANEIQSGISRILQGLFLKVVLADSIAELVNLGFARDASALSALDVWTLAFLFGFQIYFDFAGYSHIAIGSARLLGITLPENFDFPYLATSPRDFWRRWHISLSTWIRDYVYLSMIGNVKAPDSIWDAKKEKTVTGEGQRTLSLYGTWALMGLWHGANWTFVLWGIYHAAFVHAYRLASARIPWRAGIAFAWISRGITLPIIMAGWIPFRSQSIRDTLVMWGKMLDPAAYFSFGLAPNSYLVAASMTTCMIGAWLVQCGLIPRIKSRFLVMLPAQIAAYTVMVMLDIVFLQAKNQFIYFQF
jgi:alginate O-acetyltransferase complex protein AlgI